jgi:hypothetical protein
MVTADDTTPRRSEGAMLDQVLAELAALRRELAEVKSSLSGGAGGEGIYESTRAIKRDLVELRARVVLLETTVAQMKDGPVRTMGRWFDNAVPGLIVALVIAMAGMIWVAVVQTHPVPAAIVVPVGK